MSSVMSSYCTTSSCIDYFLTIPKFAILDAGYVTEEGLRQLYDDNISFITRCPTNRTIYKELMANQLADLEKAENLVVDDEGKLFNGRQVYMKCVPINYEGMKLYAYVGRDVAMRELERKQIVNRVVNSKKKPVNKDVNFYRKGTSSLSKHV